MKQQPNKQQTFLLSREIADNVLSFLLSGDFLIRAYHQNIYVD